jgi:hypothetical protein
MNWLLVLMIPTICIAACSAPANPLALEPLAAPIDATSGARIAPGLHVARTEAEWLALWRELSAARLPAPPAPPVDLAARTVLCVALGKRPSGGFGVAILGVERVGEKLVVHAHETLPAEGTQQVAMLTAPIALATIAATDLPLELALEH